MLISGDPDREDYEHHQRNGVEEMSVLGLPFAITGLPSLNTTFSSLPTIRYWACAVAVKLIAAASMTVLKIARMISSRGRSAAGC